MKTILMPFNHCLPTVEALQGALAIGRRFDAYLEGAYIRQILPIIAGEGITLPGDYLAQFEEEGRQLAADARRRFEELAAERDLPFGRLDEPSTGLRVGWNELAGSAGETIGEYARLFDLIVMSRHPEGDGPDWKTTCETVLFESGRPLLLVGDSAPDELGRRILVAWNGSMETARALACGRSLLQGADSVTVLTVQGGTVPGPDGENVAAHLRANGIAATAVTVERGERSVGEMILHEAAERGIDLLFKGAYTHSRIRQLIFGGATHEILHNATIPVFMSH
jgi:nucleotide-binding universal stress UspA family protein